MPEIKQETPGSPVGIVEVWSDESSVTKVLSDESSGTGKWQTGNYCITAADMWYVPDYRYILGCEVAPLHVILVRYSRLYCTAAGVSAAFTV